MREVFIEETASTNLPPTTGGDRAGTSTWSWGDVATAAPADLLFPLGMDLDYHWAPSWVTTVNCVITVAHELFKEAVCITSPPSATCLFLAQDC